MKGEQTSMNQVLDMELPVTHVVVFEDRARVTRSARLALTAGTARLRISNVSPVIADRSLIASLTHAEAPPALGAPALGAPALGAPALSAPALSAPAARVQKARILREKVARDSQGSVDVRQLSQRLRGLELDWAEFQLRERELAFQIEQLTELESRYMRELAEDVAFGRSVPESASSELSDLSNRKRAVLCEAVDQSERGADLREAILDLKHRIEASQDPSSELRAHLLIDVEADAATHVDLRVDYTVPNAAFRPQHAATLQANAVAFASDACVWQRTGEDWQQVELRFSTERPSLGLDVPVLTADVLSARRAAPTIVVETREEKLHVAGLGTGTQSPPGELPGIDDGGEPLEFVAAARVTIPSDGRPHRVPLQRFESRAQLGLVCRPELAPCVFRRAVLENESRRPLLAGPVDLVEGGGFVGRGKVLFVAPGERFELGFGIEPEFAVQRSSERLEPTRELMSSFEGTTDVVRVHLRNLSSEAKSVEVVERVPLSELEKVVVELDRELTSPTPTRFDPGFVSWQVHLTAYSATELKLAYIVKRHALVSGI